MHSFFDNCKPIESRREYLSFLSNKKNSGLFSVEEISSYILSDDCTCDIDDIINGVFSFSIPSRRTLVINGKKRQLYQFSDRETMLLSFVNYRLHCYDNIFINNLHSGILDRKTTAVPAKIRSHPGISNCYCYRTDIHSYGSSIDREILIGILQDYFHEDPTLLSFLIKLANVDRCIEQGIECSNVEAVKMGLPLTPFYENLYLDRIDKLLDRKAELYIRYCDDIIIYGQSLREITELRKLFLNEISSLHLSVNMKHEHIYSPGEFVNYIGYTIAGSRQELPEYTLELSKNIIRTNCKHILKLRNKYNLGSENAMVLMAQLNNKIIDKLEVHFRHITDIENLKRLDRYMVDSMRIAGSGHYYQSSAKYRIKYDDIKKCGYKSPVHEYYRYRKATHLRAEINS